MTATTAEKTQPKTEQLWCRVTEEEKEKVEALADMLDTTVAALLRDRVDELTERHDRIVARARSD